jgi:hypothetical protein
MTETPNLPRTDMLFAWANHLINEKLGNDNFDFTNYHHEKSCGTFGCAIGELPYVFPETFYLTGYAIAFFDDEESEEYLVNKETSLRKAFNLGDYHGYMLYGMCHDEKMYQTSVERVTAQMVGHKIFELATELETKYYSPKPHDGN